MAGFVSAGTEAGIQGFSKEVDVRENKCHSVSVVKRHLSFFVVNVNPDLLRFGVQVNGHDWIGSEGVFVLVSQTQEPVAVSRTDRDLPLAVDRAIDHAHVPVCLLAHVDLPVMTARAEALAAEHADHAVEAFRCVHHGLIAVAAEHLLTVLRDHQSGVGGVSIQSNVH